MLRRLRPWFPWLALPLVAAILYARPLFLGETFIQRDHLQFTLSARHHLAEELRAGRLPEWWEANGLGTPFAANPNHSVTYPPAWIVAALPSPFGADLLQVLHALFGAVGLALLARRLGAPLGGALLGGAAFLGCGYVTSMNVNGIPLLTLAWTPWVAWAACGAAGAAAGGSVVATLRLAALLAGQLLSGDPAGVITSSLLALLVTAATASRPLLAFARLGAAAAAALLLAALALLPSWHLLGESTRAGGLSAEQATVWSMHPLRLLELVWPGLLGDPTDERLHLARLVADTGARGGLGPAWSLGVYVGLPVVILAVTGALSLGTRRARVTLGVGALLFLILALGEHTPLYGAYRAVFLPERLVRYPEKHVAGALVLACALAGVGFARLLGGAPTRRALVGVALALLGVAALVVAAYLARDGLAAALAARRPTRPPPVDVERAVTLLLEGGAALLGVAALFGAALLACPRVPRVVPLLAAGALVVDLVGHAWPLLPTSPRATVMAPPEWWRPAPAPATPRERLFRPGAVAHIPLSAGPAEVAAIYHETLGDRSAMRLGLSQVPGHDPARSAGYTALWQAAGGRALGRLLDLFDVRWALLPAEDPRGAALRPALDAPFGHRLYENEARRPRAFVTDRWSWVEGSERALLAPDLDFHAVRLEGRGPPGAGAGPLRPCHVAGPRPEERRVSCPGAPAGYAVLLDAWSAGWSATVDGRPAPVLRAEGIARAVAVPEGAREIVWRYRTPGLRLGAAVSAAAWLVWLGALLFARRRGSP